MNRRDRRAARAITDRAAALLASSCVHLARGTGFAVADPLAVRVLTRGFAHCLRGGGAPHVTQITAEEAAALAPWAPPPKGWPTYLAVGIDRLGRGAYVSRPVKIEGASPTQARRIIEARLLAELQPLLEDTSWPPAPEAATR